MTNFSYLNQLRELTELPSFRADSLEGQALLSAITQISLLLDAGQFLYDVMNASQHEGASNDMWDHALTTWKRVIDV